GILKAGAAYVPLDPANPPERLAYLLGASGAHVVLTERSVAEIIPAGSYRGVVLDGDDQPLIGQQQTDRCAAAVTPAHAAYMIYTSGSTGLPKGVVVEHGSAYNLAVAAQDHIALPPGQRILQFFSLNFDASLLDLLLTWRSGGTLCIAAGETRMPGPALVDFIQRHAIAILS